MIKILYAPFYSMRSYRTGKWLLKRDGHATRCRNIINLFCSVTYKNIKFDIIVPSNSDIRNVKDFFCEYDISKYVSNVRLIKNNFYGHNALSERMNFPFKFYSGVINKGSYDTIIYENIENARYIKNLDPCAKLISSITHSPLTEDTDFTKPSNMLLRIIDGIYASNTVFYNTSYIFDNLKQIIRKHFSDDAELLLKKLVPSYAYASNNEMKIDNPDFKKEENSVLFMSRFSDRDRTKANEFINFIKAYYKHDFKFYITNPSEDVLTADIQELLDEGKIKLLKQNNRKDWRSILQRMETVIILYDVEKCYSTGYFEAALNRCRIVTQQHKAWMYTLNGNICPISNDIEQSLNYVKTHDAKYISDNVIYNNFVVEQCLGKLASIILNK